MCPWRSIRWAIVRLGYCPDTVSKYTLQDGIKSDEDCFAGNKGDECHTDTPDNDSDSGDSDDEAYTLPP